MASRKRKRSGGHRQRLQQIHAEELGFEGPQSSSSLVELLLEKWSWGEMSAQDVQAIAFQAVKDFENGADLSRLKEIGAAGIAGKYPNKVYAQVYKIAIAARGIALPSPFLTRIPFKSPWNMMMQAVMLPHVLFASIFADYKATWAKSICPSTEAVEGFWNSMLASKNPNLSTHITRRRNWQTSCIPLALHGDGVPICGLGKGWVQTVTNWSFYSLLTTSTAVADSLFFIYAMLDKMRKDAKDLSGTAHHFFLLLKWSFEIMFAGVWPEADYLGKQCFGLVYKHYM